MDELILSRRAVYGALTGAAGLAALGSSAGSAALRAPAPAAGALPPLRRFMKIYASLGPGTIWYWYSGVIDMAQPDAPITPLAAIETLIRRDVSPNADGTFTVVSSEANYFHGLDDVRPIERIVNPLTGRTVQPLHFSEGPRSTICSEQSLAPRRSGGIETSVAWRDAGPYRWLYRTLHADTPHPLDMSKWPLEASGPRSRTGSFSTHCALARDVLDPRLSTAPCSFAYDAVFGWLPWLLMGQRPGQLLWRANGLKLPALGDLPTEARAGFESTFPAIFAGGDFGPGGANLWDRYKASRRPAG